MCHGLIRTEMNGCIGSITVFDAEKQRYAVSLPNGSSVLLKVENLKRHAPAAASVPSAACNETEEQMQEDAPSKDALLRELHDLLHEGMLKANLLKVEGDERTASSREGVRLS